MSIVFRLSGGDDLAKAIAKLDRDVTRAVQRAIDDVVLFAESEIVSKFEEGVYSKPPVDTGRLLGSITAKTAFRPGDSATNISPDGLSAVVGTNVEYAIPVHEGYTRTLKGRRSRSAFTTRQRLGTSTRLQRVVPGRPFIADAVPAIEENLAAAIEEELRGI